MYKWNFSSEMWTNIYWEEYIFQCYEGHYVTTMTRKLEARISKDCGLGKSGNIDAIIEFTTVFMAFDQTQQRQNYDQRLHRDSD